MSNAMSTNSCTVYTDRQTDGIKLITSGLRRVEEGLKILIGELGMSVPQVHKALAELDYEELSIHQLYRITTKMRKVGELPAATTGANTGAKAKKTRASQICEGPVENSTPTQPSKSSPPVDAEQPTIEWSSELYTHLNDILCEFVLKFERLSSTDLVAGEWKQLGQRAQVIAQLCDLHQYSLQRDGGTLPEF